MANKYKKADLVKSIAEASSITGAEAERQYNNVVAGLEAQLSEMEPKDTLQLVGTLTFEVVRREAYEARNPKTKEAVEVPATNRLKVKAGKGLIDLIV